MKISHKFLLLTAALACQASLVSAANITPGFTYAVATNGSDSTTGNHFHSNTGGAFGNPAGKAEVGNFSSEVVRGLSEYNLTGLTSGPAFVTFSVFNDGGLFSGTNDFPFDGTIDIYSYQGNNAEDISDFQAGPATLVGSFSTVGLVVGNTKSFDISTQFNAAVAANWTSLGIRLQRSNASTTSSGAWTFDTFRLTSTDDSTPTVPEGGPLLPVLGLALAGLFVAKRKIA